MRADLEALGAQVLKLSPEDRARLLDRLILSHDEDKLRDDAWDALAAQRDSDIGNGKVSEVVGAEALARLLAKFG